jgi:hypothetical protein
MRRRWSDRSSRHVRTLVTQLARSRPIRESGRMRADIHSGPEHTLQSEAGYSIARPRQPDRRNLLHRTAGPYSWVIMGFTWRPACACIVHRGFISLRERAACRLSETYPLTARAEGWRNTQRFVSGQTVRTPAERLGTTKYAKHGIRASRDRIS